MLELRNVYKKYENHLAVNDVTFQVPSGTVFGLLGPNGAGKTSLIRMITTITRADSGEILLLNKPVNADTPTMIGYMPEERGLYKKMKVGEQLLYLAQLKGMKKLDASQQIMLWLERLEMTHCFSKKVEELSKGMQQKIQFITTVVHRPPLLILDEPFSGLDPVSSELLKKQIDKLHQNGTTILFSTHRMEQVEAICQRIVLINRGQNILEGEVSDIKNAHKENQFHVSFQGELPADVYQFAHIISNHPSGEITIQVNDEKDANKFLSFLINRNIHIKSFNEILPSLNEIFIKKVSNAIA